MKKTKLLLLSILSVLVIMSSCKKDDDPDPVNQAEVLVEYLESMPNSNIATLASYVSVPTQTKAGGAVLNDLMDDGTAYIIDVRGATDFGNGHIVGAINVDIGAGESVLEHVANNIATIGTKTIVMVCYSGQSAAFEAALVKMAGYENVSSLLFGMCGWKEDIHANWTNAVASDSDADPVTTSFPKGPEFELPELDTDYETGPEILMARLMAVEAAGFGALATTGDMTVSNSSSWYVMNYWNADHYGMMHIDNAIMYDPTATPNPFTTAGDLNTIPTDGTTSVVYCYTGQTSAWVATYLNVLGYNVKTMTYGVNGLWGKDDGAETKMPGTRWLDYAASHNLNGALHNDQ